MAEQSTTDRSSGSGAHGAREATLADRLRYRFDSTLARGAHVVMAWLGLATLLLAVAATALVQLTGLSGVSGKEHLALGDVFWESVMRVLGRGAAASDAGWATRAFGFVMLVIGLLIGGALIALISTAVRERIVALRKGRSFVSTATP